MTLAAAKLATPRARARKVPGRLPNGRFSKGNGAGRGGPRKGIGWGGPAGGPGWGGPARGAGTGGPARGRSVAPPPHLPCKQKAAGLGLRDVEELAEYEQAKAQARAEIEARAFEIAISGELTVAQAINLLWRVHVLLGGAVQRKVMRCQKACAGKSFAKPGTTSPCTTGRCWRTAAARTRICSRSCWRRSATGSRCSG